MIKPCSGYEVNGQMYPILKDAQHAALLSIIQKEAIDREAVVPVLLNRRQEIIEILSMDPPKERKTRADKGTRRTKKIAPVAKETPHVNPPEVGATVEGSGKYRGK